MKKSLKIILFFAVSLHAQAGKNNTILIEAESFRNKVGWVVDQQFMDVMGSPFLMAHGNGFKVKDAATDIQFPANGIYRVFVRTRNWAARWSLKDAPGKFQLLLNGQTINAIFGTECDNWQWQYGGTVAISQLNNSLALKDLTGFDGRCDAILFTNDSLFLPPNETSQLAILREKLNLKKVENAGKFDFVVVGGGMAGTCAAITAARLGLKVALVQDRPVLGGNNSSEIRVHLGGRVNLEPYHALGNLVNEIGPTLEGNARPEKNYEDQKKMDAVRNEKNISLFINYHANKVNMKKGRIVSIEAEHIENGEKILLMAPLFADCTGDATIGMLAAAKYMTGRENSIQFDEKMAPPVADKMTMGSSVQWFAEKQDTVAPFPDIQWGLDWNEQKTEKITRGDWNWETGMGKDQVLEFEQIRDYGLMVVYSNWSYLKNYSQDKQLFENEQLKWVAYIAGKRESKRLVGDYVLRESDIINHNVYPDGTASSSWSIDLHYPDSANSILFPKNEFKSIANHTIVNSYPIPFRCLYSVNIPNLMMAGRNISVTHIALGTVRVMRTTGMMGEVIGMAAAICKQKNADPRGVYTNYFEDLKKLMDKGIGNATLPKIQNYNLGDTKDIKH